MEKGFYLVFLFYAIIATLVPSSTQLAIDSVPSTFSLTDNKRLIDSFVYPILNSSQLEVISKEANQTAIDTETKFDLFGFGNTSKIQRVKSEQFNNLMFFFFRNLSPIFWEFRIQRVSLQQHRKCSDKFRQRCYQLSLVRHKHGLPCCKVLLQT
jgi:hypothetical protein